MRRKVAAAAQQVAEKTERLKNPERVKIGRRSRMKGKTFERTVVNLIKDRFKSYDWALSVRRSDQGFGAKLSDVTNWPHIWCECQTAANATPAEKLAQAVRDMEKAVMSGGDDSFPIAIVRPMHSPKITVTLQLGDLIELVCLEKRATPINGVRKAGEFPVTMSIDAFFDIYEHWYDATTSY